MNRDQKAMAAYGSVAVVGIFLVLAWSRAGGLVILVLGLVAVSAALRLTHPGRNRPGAATWSPTSRTSAPGVPRGAQVAQEEQRAELQRRREAATARTLGRDGSQPS